MEWSDRLLKNLFDSPSGIPFQQLIKCSVPSRQATCTATAASAVLVVRLRGRGSSISAPPTLASVRTIGKDRFKMPSTLSDYYAYYTDVKSAILYYCPTHKNAQIWLSEHL